MQEHKENILIERIKETVRTNRHATGEVILHRQIASPLVTAEDIAQAEAQIGFELPPFLSRLYLEIGDGGFGPGYGLLPLNNHNTSIDSLVTAYLGMKSMSQKDIDEYWANEEEKPSLWPERVLMVCDWGCNIYSSVNCASPDLVMYRLDSNINFMVEWAIEASSLQDWLEAWVDGKPLADLDWEQAAKVSVSDLGNA
ncbi:MAG: SMI1/KNR4 family protein [Chloroflexota bacterium]|nr:SMI1/KNR4 family protein [Chloroflexota bacterium]